MSRLGTLKYVLAVISLASLTVAPGTLAATSTLPGEGFFVPLVLADQSSTVVAPPPARSARAANALSARFNAPAPLLLSTAEPSFVEIVQSSPMARSVPVASSVDAHPEPTNRGWGHVVAGLSMILFVALRRSASL